MDRLLTDEAFLQRYGHRLTALCAAHGWAITPITLPADPAQRLAPGVLADITVAGFTGTWEADPRFTRRFFGSVLRADRLQWMHVPNAGVDDPVFEQLLAKGVRLTTSAGASAEPIAQTAIGGLLALARGFPSWWSAQQRCAWEPLSKMRLDLRGQTLLLVGVGAIGNQIGRLARSLGLRVIGVRRTARRETDEVDELHPPSALPRLLPGANWLVLACPLTDETRNLIDAAALASLPPDAHVINVGRGAVIDEEALIAALQEGRLAGAYLDVFESEPLSPHSPLWKLPNVILSPHDASGSSGNAGRVSELFLRNLEHWARREPLENEVFAAGR
jgi:phosphoglycerate dehydrogenase-like enzyme